ncbi:hypothetical protein C5E51_35440 [Nocardia nova]|nr:hypothetical protein C5E51_35440 [Nocardia nova]
MLEAGGEGAGTCNVRCTSRELSDVSRQLGGLLVTVAVVLASAACGGSDGSTTSTTTTEATAEPTFETPSAPVGFSCDDVGGRFQQNYPDGRGVCVSANPDPACHKNETYEADHGDSWYLEELTMTPPTANGRIDTPRSIQMASNQQCWHLPPTFGH